MEKTLFNLAAVIISFAIIVAFVLIVGLCIEETPPGPATVETVTVEQEQVEPVQCEHEFVTTSKYMWLRQSYKTISKCTKCGEEI